MLLWLMGSEHAEELQSLLSGGICPMVSEAHQCPMLLLCWSLWPSQHQPTLCRVLLLSRQLLPLLGSPWCPKDQSSGEYSAPQTRQQPHVWTWWAAASPKLAAWALPH